MKTQLKEDILNYIHTGQGDFNQLALLTFEYQYLNCLPYQHYCQQLNRLPKNVKHWHQIPSVPTDVFREFKLCTFDFRKAKYVFQTSGTTQDETGKHYYQDMSLYDATIQNSFLKGLNLSNQKSLSLRILTPTFTQVMTSSLYYMLQRIVEWYGDETAKFYFKENDIDYESVIFDLKTDIKRNRRVVLIGTAFSFVNLFDFFKENLHLPADSVLMETGGLKGRARSISRQELYDLFVSRLGLKLDHCFSEYGMTELSSQCYSQANSHTFSSPFWMPCRLINPINHQEVVVGESGLIQFFDLANLEAISAITTADLAIKHEQGFELMGRAPEAKLRGCSTVFEK